MKKFLLFLALLVALPLPLKAELTGFGDQTEIIGGSTGSVIGNVSDALKVTGDLTVTQEPTSLDAFGRLRVSTPETLFSYMPTSGKHNEDLWNEDIIGGATSTLETDKNAIKLSVGTASGDKAIRATNRYLVYTPGKSSLVMMSGNFEGSLTNVRKRWGLFDDKNGLFFELDGTTLKVVVRSNTSGSPVDTAITQANWNMDKLDGTGTSGITLDLTTYQIPYIDFQYLGAGKVRFGFEIAGKLHIVHEVLHANSTDVMYMESPHLPFRAEIENLAATAGHDFRVSCFSYTVEGAPNPNAHVATVTSGTDEVAVTTTEAPIFSVRLKSTHNRLSIKPLNIQIVMVDGSKPMLIRAYLNGSLTGASWSDAGDISEIDTSATAITGGDEQPAVIVNTKKSSTSAAPIDFKTDLFLGRDISGKADILTFTAESTSGASEIIWVHLFKEFI